MQVPKPPNEIFTGRGIRKHPPNQVNVLRIRRIFKIDPLKINHRCPNIVCIDFESSRTMLIAAKRSWTSRGSDYHVPWGPIRMKDTTADKVQRQSEHGREDSFAVALAKVIAKDIAIFHFLSHRDIASPSQRRAPIAGHRPSFHPVEERRFPGEIEASHTPSLRSRRTERRDEEDRQTRTRHGSIRDHRIWR